MKEDTTKELKTVQDAIKTVYEVNREDTPEAREAVEFSDLLTVARMSLNAVRAVKSWPVRDALYRAVKRGKVPQLPLHLVPWGRAKWTLQLKLTGERIAGNFGFRTKEQALRFFAALKASSRIAAREIAENGVKGELRYGRM